jgi:carbamate kinase
MRIVLALGGNALLHRGEHPYPLDALNVQAQGLIGYWRLCRSYRSDGGNRFDIRRASGTGRPVRDPDPRLY